MTAKTPPLLAALLMALAPCLVLGEEDVFTDDFSQEIEGRWQVITGEWKVKDGRMTHGLTEFPHHSKLLAEFPLSEGMIEVTAMAREASVKYKFASIGIMVKYLEEKKHLVFRFGSYNGIKIDGAGPGFEEFDLGRGGPELNREYVLKVIIRHGIIGVCIDDRMIAVLRDLFAGKTGRVGLFTETGSEFDNVRITRYAP